MATKSRPFTAKSITGRDLPDGLHRDGGARNLYLQVAAGGTRRSWIFRYEVNGRQRWMGIGSIELLTLAEARAKALELRKLLKIEGIDPIEHRRAQRAAAVPQAAVPTFEAEARAYIKAHRAGWRNPKHAAQWEASLEQHCAPIWAMPVDEVHTAHVMQCLEPEWRTKTETLKRVRGRIEVILDAARVRGHRSGENPARWRGHLDKLLAAPGKVQKREHFASMPYAELPAFWQRLQAVEGIGALALQWTILTVARSGETRGAAWAEIDLEGGTWTIPGSRMKGGRPHRVPLSKQAVELLAKVPRIAGSDLVFPSSRGGPLSDMTLSAVLRRLEVPYTVHGFRSTFSTWTAEQTNAPSEVREACLAHVSADKVAMAYMRSDFEAKRAKLLQQWASFVTTRPQANVVPITGKKGGSGRARAA